MGDAIADVPRTATEESLRGETPLITGTDFDKVGDTPAPKVEADPQETLTKGLAQSPYPDAVKNEEPVGKTPTPTPTEQPPGGVAEQPGQPKPTIPGATTVDKQPVGGKSAPPVEAQPQRGLSSIMRATPGADLPPPRPGSRFPKD